MAIETGQSAPFEWDEDDTDRADEAQEFHPLLRMLLSGLGGSATLTLLHEGARQVAPHTPRMDVIGQRSLAAAMRAVGKQPPRPPSLYRWSMIGDLASNALFYSLVAAGSPRGVWLRGAILGAGAGLSAVLLPRPLGLGRQSGSRPPLTPALTVAWYTIGGLAAAATYRTLSSAEG